MIQVPKNNRFRKNKKQVRVGKTPKKEVEPIAPNSEAESQTKYATYVGIPIQVKNKINEEEAIPPPYEAGECSSSGSRRPGHCVFPVMYAVVGLNQ